MTARDRGAEEAATRSEAESVAGEIGLYFHQPDADIQMEYVWLDEQPTESGWWRLTWEDGPQRWAATFFTAVVENDTVSVNPSLHFDIEDSADRVLVVALNI